MQKSDNYLKVKEKITKDKVHARACLEFSWGYVNCAADFKLIREDEREKLLDFCDEQARTAR